MWKSCWIFIEIDLFDAGGGCERHRGERIVGEEEMYSSVDRL
jgi:hypothetical protein